MRTFSFTLMAASTLMSCASALAQSSRSFETNVESRLTGPVKVEVTIGENLAYRADNLPRKLSDRGNARSLRDGFGGNGYYGEKDLNRLAGRLSERLARELENDGVQVVDEAPTIIRMTITDARPNRPTFNQLSVQPGLSFRSFAVGGASFEGEVISNGQSVGTLSYAWYETDIRNTAFGSGTWTDANRAISRFADRVSDHLAERVPG
ncbi:MAG: hypothetical protein GDA39_09805 [Hyphomonadaceae bacterium]|nr:hypothetical protein [Hyphomonadaceae bacterium]MBC6413129.1 hypothetical protein [Hyphomonadaceae bacterium]